MTNISHQLRGILEKYSPDITASLLPKVEEMESAEYRNSAKEILQDIPYVGDCLVLRWDKEMGKYNISPYSTFNSIPEWIEYGITSLSAKMVCDILNISFTGDTPESTLWKKGGRNMAGVKALINEAIKKANIQE